MGRSGNCAAHHRAVGHNAHVFESLEDAKETLTSDQCDYTVVLSRIPLEMLSPEHGS
jgi:hypothetical protein